MADTGFSNEGGEKIYSIKENFGSTSGVGLNFILDILGNELGKDTDEYLEVKNRLEDIKSEIYTLLDNGGMILNSGDNHFVIPIEVLNLDFSNLPDLEEIGYIVRPPNTLKRKEIININEEYINSLQPEIKDFVTKRLKKGNVVLIIRPDQLLNNLAIIEGRVTLSNIKHPMRDTLGSITNNLYTHLERIGIEIPKIKITFNKVNTLKDSLIEMILFDYITDRSGRVFEA
ncbi:MAG: hypothetical protein Q9M91_01810 [Candidatus Dojkabacteria bacterium]|nr:hypothetical protein [Candidatus Dojkabacteria bacterium]